MDRMRRVGTWLKLVSTVVLKGRGFQPRRRGAPEILGFFSLGKAPELGTLDFRSAWRHYG